MQQIIFEFAGGPFDGKQVRGALGEQGEADRYYTLTHHGRPGQRFRIASMYAVDRLAHNLTENLPAGPLPMHHYVVTDRLEGFGEVVVRAEYMPDRHSQN